MTFWHVLAHSPFLLIFGHQQLTQFCLEGMILKLKLQYFGYFMRRVDSLEKTLMLGGIGDRRRRGRQSWDGWMASRPRWTRVWVNSGSWWWTGRPGVLRFMGSQRVGHDWATEMKWTELILNLTDKSSFKSMIATIYLIIHAYIYQRGQWQPTPVLCLENPMDRGAW